MISKTLEKAREYEQALDSTINREDRPAFHMSVRTGWMNDPNGFSYYKGQYHVFYQYNPYDTQWGPMHWGHAVSDDMLRWEYLPAALAPDEAYDAGGCFSGSALTMPDGKQLLIYTGVAQETSPEINTIQTQCIALGDGCDYNKYNKNPVLDGDVLPEGACKSDFRDPKIWQKKDGTFRCVVGNRTLDGDGQVLLFESADGLNWQFEKILAANRSRFGKMWECPDFFQLDGKGVLLVSPQDMLPDGLDYPVGNGTLCLIGAYDDKTDDFTEEGNQAIDCGIDFYAAQTLLTPDKRRVMIGWMQNWDTCKTYTSERRWFGQLSLPRELSAVGGKLYQKPIRELELLRHDKIEYRNVIVSQKTDLEGISGRVIDLQLIVRPEDEHNIYGKFKVSFAEGGGCHTDLTYYPGEGTAEIDRTFSGTRRACVHKRKCRIDEGGDKKGEIRIRLILDRFSAEAFINDGRQVITTTFYTHQSADGISFSADGTAIIDVIKYDLT